MVWGIVQVGEVGAVWVVREVQGGLTMASQSATSSSRRKKLKGKNGYPERPASAVLSSSVASS